MGKVEVFHYLNLFWKPVLHEGNKITDWRKRKRFF